MGAREARRCAGTAARRAAQAARGGRNVRGLDARYDYGGGRMAELLDVDAGLAQRLGLEQVIPDALRAERRARARVAGRRAAGVQPRALWLAAHPLNRECPWQAEGVSRATYRLGPVAEAVDAAYAKQGEIAEPQGWIRAHISKNYGDAALKRPAPAFTPASARICCSSRRTGPAATSGSGSIACPRARRPIP